MMPGAIPESVLDSIKTSVAVEYANQQHVAIDDDVLATYAASLDKQAVVEATSAVRMPLTFDSITSEVNFMSLMHMLDFGSGFNDLLQEKHQRSAREMAQFGLLGMYLQLGKIDAKLLSGFSHYHVTSFWGVDTHVEEELQPGITISRQGPLGAYSAALLAAMVQTGAILESNGFADLGAFVLGAMGDELAAGGQPTASALVAKLSETLPAFADALQGEGGRRVIFLRKAQLLALELHERFSSEEPRLRFADVGGLSGSGSGPGPLAVLRALGVIKPTSPEAEAALDRTQDVGQGQGQGQALEAALRSAGVLACARLAAGIGIGGGAGDAGGGGGLSAAQVGLYLQRQADTQEEYASLPRMRNRGSVAY